MKSSRFLYNNEGICALGIMSILQIINSLSYSKTMLIAPLIFNENIIKYLAGNSKIRSFEEFRSNQIISISKFNNMYYNFLPLSINTIIILNDMNFIDLKDDKIKLKKVLIENVESKIFGKRANKIIKAAPKIAKLLDEAEEKLYVQLGVVL